MQRTLTCLVVLLLTSSTTATAQELAYFLYSAGPNFMTSRCLFEPDHICSGTLNTVDLASNTVLGSDRLGLSTFDSLAASTDGRTLVWALWGGGVGSIDRVTLERRTILSAGPSDFVRGPALVRAPHADLFYRLRTEGVDAFDLTGLRGSIAVPGFAAFSSAPVAMAITDDGNTGYLPVAGGLVILNLVTLSSAPLSLPGGFTWSVTVTPDGSNVYALRSAASDPSGPITLYRIRGGVVIDSRMVSKPGLLLPSTDGSRLWLSEGNHDVPVSTKTIRLLNASTLVELSSVTVANPVNAMTLSSTGAKLYVSTTLSLDTIDTTTPAVIQSLPLSLGPTRPLVTLPATAPCQFVVSPRTLDAPASGGLFSVSVPAPAGCTWTARSADAWVQNISPAAASGTGTVTFTITPNTNSAARLSTLTIASQTIAAVQPPEVPPAGAPTAPIGLSAMLQPGRLLTLTWHAATSGPVPTRFIVEAGSATGTSDLANVSAGPATNVTGGPLADRHYFVRVRGANDAGIGAPSNEIQVNAFSTPAAINFVNVAWFSPDEGAITWDESIYSSVRYRIELVQPLGQRTPLFDLTERRIPLRRGMAPANSYSVQVRGINESGFVGPSPEFGPTAVNIGTCLAAPSAPTVNALVVMGGVVALNLGAQSLNPFESFRIFAGRTFGASDLGVVDVTGPTISATLPPGRYYVRVATVNKCGMSPLSAEQTFVIP